MGSDEGTNLRYCGVETQQFDDFSIKVTCEQTSLKLGLVNLSLERAKQVESNVTQTKRDQLMNVCGSLMSIARSCRPGISHNTSRWQSAIRKATVEDILIANRTVKHVEETATVGIWHRSGIITWPSKDDPSVRTCVAAVSDASHVNE